MPNGTEGLELAREVHADALAADPDQSVEVLPPDHVGRFDLGCRVGDEGVTEGVNAISVQLQARGGAVAAVAIEVLGGGVECRHQVESRDAAGRPLGAASVHRKQDRGPEVALDQAGGRDPDHAGMPSLAGEDERGGVLQVESVRAVRARSAPSTTFRSVQRRSAFALSSSAAIAAARSGSSVSISSTPASAR